jgi:hypothetical protein
MDEQEPERDGAANRDGSSDVERFSISVTYGPTDNRGVLLKLVSALHRRGIEPLTANLADSGSGQGCFRAAFAATPSRARTAAETLRNVVGVTEVDITRDDQ